LNWFESEGGGVVYNSARKTSEHVYQSSRGTSGQIYKPIRTNRDPEMRSARASSRLYTGARSTCEGAAGRPANGQAAGWRRGWGGVRLRCGFDRLYFPSAFTFRSVGRLQPYLTAASRVPTVTAAHERAAVPPARPTLPATQYAVPPSTAQVA